MRILALATILGLINVPLGLGTPTYTISFPERATRVCLVSSVTPEQTISCDTEASVVDGQRVAQIPGPKIVPGESYRLTAFAEGPGGRSGLAIDSAGAPDFFVVDTRKPDSPKLLRAVIDALQSAVDKLEDAEAAQALDTP